MTKTCFKLAVTDIAPELTTRPVGALARSRLIQALGDFGSVEIDFLNKSLTPSFADECVGRLAEHMGLQQFKSCVKLVNVSETSKALIRHVVAARCRKSLAPETA